MKKMAQKCMVLLLVSVVLLSTAIAVYAMDNPVYFSGTIKANQADTEISTVKRATDKNYFQVEIVFYGNTQTYVNAWAEKDDLWGTNLSSPSIGVQIATEKSIVYNTIPNTGVNVTLNLDNPVKESAAYTIEGNWTPN